MPVVASHVAVWVCGAHVCAGRVFVMVVADRILRERFLADAAFFDVPVLGFFFWRENSKVVVAKISVGFVGALFDVCHVLLHEVMWGLSGSANLVDLLEDLVTVLHSPDDLVEAVRQDLVNSGG